MVWCGVVALWCCGVVAVVAVVAVVLVVAVVVVVVVVGGGLQASGVFGALNGFWT